MVVIVFKVHLYAWMELYCRDLIGGNQTGGNRQLTGHSYTPFANQ